MAVDWMNPLEIQRDAVIFGRLIHVLLGIYAWEWFVSLGFDFDFLTGKRTFRWPLVFYFANRYLLLGALIGILVSLDNSTELNCQSLYTFNQLAGNASTGLASINLSLRTMAVWQHNRWIDGLLILIILGHWSLVLQGVVIKATWVESPVPGCQIIETNTTILSAVFIYTMCFDAIVLFLNALKLVGNPFKTVSPDLVQSRLSKMIFGDGLIYFLVAFITNVIATVFMLLNWNPVMSIIFNVPAVIASTIVATRAVRRLMNYGKEAAAVEVYGTVSSTGGATFRQATAAGRMGQSIIPTQGAGLASVHVQMETFSKTENVNDKDIAYLHSLKDAQFAARTPDSDSYTEHDNGKAFLNV